jgi:hypothetical protein
MARMTPAYIAYRKKQVLKNIKEGNTYDMADHEHDEKRKKKDGRKRI